MVFYVSHIGLLMNSKHNVTYEIVHVDSRMGSNISS